MSRAARRKAARATTLRLGRHGELIPVSGFSRREARTAAPNQSVWRSHDGLLVISSCDVAPLPGSGEPPIDGPQWLVTVSRKPVVGGPRCSVTDEDLQRVVEGFAMPAFDEDNHHPGVARHLWCPIEEQYRSACECKLNEVTITEANGYQWTTEDDHCRGCEYERDFGLPCTIHKATV